MARNRKDAKLIRNLTSTQRVIYYLKKKRCDSDVYINMKVEMTNAIKYIEKQEESCCLDDDTVQGSHSPKTTPHNHPL